MIEVVLNSDTTANITAEQGDATKVFAKSTFVNWLQEHNNEQGEFDSVSPR